MHTFLFADLVGFTALSIEHGDEQAADVATRFQREVKACAARHDATVVKSLGDGAMVCARDAGDALRLGLELTNGLDSLPPVRVGLNTGPAVERDGDFFGSTVNLAARDPVVVYAASERQPLRERALAAKRRFACPHTAARTKVA